MESKSTVLIDNKKSVPKEFNRIASSYDFATGMSQGYQADLNFSSSFLELKGDELVLDICCGTGKSTKALLPYMTTGKIIGIDNSEGMLKEANKKFHKECLAGTLEFQLKDAMELNVEPNSVDAIFMAYGLRNMPDYEKCVENLFKILKPGGRLVIHDYSLANKWISKPLWGVLGYGFIVPFCTVVSGSSKIFRYLIKSVYKFLSPDQVKTLLLKKGFTNVKSSSHKGWRAPILHAFYGLKPN